MQIKLLRIFTTIQEGDELKPSIIAHMKRPYSTKNVDMGNGQGKEVVTMWQHYVQINLWIIEFNFEWIK